MINIGNIFEWPVKRQLIFFAIFFIIILYLGLWFFNFSLMNKLATEQKKENTLKQELVGAIDKTISARRELAIYRNYASNLSTWEQSLVDYANLPQLLNDILKIGETNNISFILFDPEEKVRADRYSKVPIKVIAIGSYHQIAGFFSQIANLDKIISITKFEITSENKPDVIGVELAKKATAENLLTASFILEIYYLDVATQMEELAKAAAELKEKKAAKGKPAPSPKTTSTKP